MNACSPLTQRDIISLFIIYFQKIIIDINSSVCQNPSFNTTKKSSPAASQHITMEQRQKHFYTTAQEKSPHAYELRQNTELTSVSLDKVEPQLVLKRFLFNTVDKMCVLYDQKAS